MNIPGMGDPSSVLAVQSRGCGSAQLIDVVLPLAVACISAKLSLMSMVGTCCDEQLLWGGLG